MTEPLDHRAEALDAAKAAETFDATALTHAVIHLADKVAEIVAAISRSVVRATEGTPKLQALLDDDSPLQSGEDPTPVILPNGRVYRPAHDPRHWAINPENGMWVSPAGREFKPNSAQVLGVIRRLENMRKNGTLYTTPLRPLDSAK